MAPSPRRLEFNYTTGVQLLYSYYMKKTQIRLGAAYRPHAPGKSVGAGSGMDPEVEDILFSVAGSSEGGEPDGETHGNGQQTVNILAEQDEDGR